ncbi:MAG: hypothetical protein WCG36_09800 [bacterium]
MNHAYSTETHFHCIDGEWPPLTGRPGYQAPDYYSLLKHGQAKGELAMPCEQITPKWGLADY